MTDCQQFADDLKAYADGELPWLQRRAVRRHLTRCASCREEISAMTQIAEDLRSTEPEDALSPSLREKLLEVLLAPNNGGTRLDPSNSPIIGVGGASSRKRPVLAWGIAGGALIAWFVLFPMFHAAHEASQQGAFQSAPSAAHEMHKSAVRLPASHTAPGQPVSFTVRLSDREAGIDNNGQPSIQIKNPNSQYQDRSGAAQTFDANEVVSIPDRQVHKEASIGIQVANPEATGDTVETMVKETGGYVAANNLTTGDDGLKTGELIVKVPVTQFETFLAQVAKLGNVQSKNISGEDITEKTSDATQTEGVLEDDVQQSEARLKLLGGKAKWRDEEATRDLRIQLAQARARLVLLKRMAALGTLTIDLSQTPKAVPPAPVTGGFWDGLKANTHDALQSLIGSAGALLALVIWLLAYAPIWVTIILVGRFAYKAYQKREVGA